MPVKISEIVGEMVDLHCSPRGISVYIRGVLHKSPSGYYVYCSGSNVPWQGANCHFAESQVKSAVKDGESQYLICVA